MKKELFNYVHELLSKKEHIIVPNFGAFVLQKTTTFLNDGEYISIIFSTQQQNDDKVLSTYIAEKNACSIDDADEFIELTLEAIYSQIEDKGSYKIEGIGEFKAINERIVFKPFEEQFLIKSDEKENHAVMPGTENSEVKEEKISEPIPKLIEEEAPFILVTETKKEDRIEGKVDIETIRQTYAERDHQPKKEEETKTVEKEEVTEKVKTSIDLSKFKTPIMIIIIIAVLGITGYIFRSEIALLYKPTQTNDTTSVVTQQNINQLTDTLQDIENTPAPEISNTESSTNEYIAEQNTLTEASAEVIPNTIASEPVAAPVSIKTYFGNTNETKYYVTKAAYGKLSDASAEKNNLDHTGFIATIIETDGTKKYHVVVAEFNNISDAEKELAFTKQIDKRFYLMTVKPRNK